MLQTMLPKQPWGTEEDPSSGLGRIVPGHFIPINGFLNVGETFTSFHPQTTL